MTLAKAERITGLRIEQQTSPAVGYLYHGFFDGVPEWLAGVIGLHQPWVVGSGPTHAAALQELVNENLTKNARIIAVKQAWTCARCGRREPLQAHHQKIRSRGRDDKISNLEALCASCHEKAHR